ncbi:MAG: hypothetical protein PHD48_05590 [Alphaproteobacteria bacterium]|nr:hypothetical protein [Alphaproteobacteria bacterium]
MKEVIEASDDKAAKLAQDILTLMESLVAIIEQENMLLDQKDYAAMELLRVEKMKMVRHYQQQMAAIGQNENQLKTLPQALRTKIRQVGLKLAQISKSNAVALKSAITGTQAFLQTIMSAAQKQSKNMDSYADPRKARALLGSYSPIANPVAVDRTA